MGGHWDTGCSGAGGGTAGWGVLGVGETPRDVGEGGECGVEMQGDVE